jgi:hypothetical protein
MQDGDAFDRYDSNEYRCRGLFPAAHPEHPTPTRSSQCPEPVFCHTNDRNEKEKLENKT